MSISIAVEIPAHLPWYDSSPYSYNRSSSSQFIKLREHIIMSILTLFIYLGESAHVIILRKLLLDIKTKSSNISHTFIIHNIDNTMCKDLKLK